VSQLAFLHREWGDVHDGRTGSRTRIDPSSGRRRLTRPLPLLNDDGSHHPPVERAVVRERAPRLEREAEVPSDADRPGVERAVVARRRVRRGVRVGPRHGRTGRHRDRIRRISAAALALRARRNRDGVGRIARPAGAGRRRWR